MSAGTPGHEVFSQLSRKWWGPEQSLALAPQPVFPRLPGHGDGPAQPSPSSRCSERLWDLGGERCWGFPIMTAPLPSHKLPETQRWIHQSARH